MVAVGGCERPRGRRRLELGCAPDRECLPGDSISTTCHVMVLVCSRTIDPDNPLEVLFDQWMFVKLVAEARMMLEHFKA